MRNRFYMISRVSAVALTCLIFLSFFPGSILCAVVSLKSVEFDSFHQWIPRKPAIYFKCNGENKTSLPDIQEADVLYSFKGEESWQPVTKLLTLKCKRCGFYVELVGADHVFDEWELCASDFSAPDGSYTRLKENEFNATFLCKECPSLAKDSTPATEKSGQGKRKKKYVIPALVTVAVIVSVAVASVAAFRYWQKKKRQQEQARFLKLFEEDDDIEDELGLRDSHLLSRGSHRPQPPCLRDRGMVCRHPTLLRPCYERDY